MLSLVVDLLLDVVSPISELDSLVSIIRMGSVVKLSQG